MTDRILFACDYEGTYNKEPGKHPKEDEVNAIRRLRSAGHLVALVFERDGFLTMANMGEYEEEYDFILASTGGCLIARLPIDPPRYGVPTRIFTDTANQYFLSELYDLFRSVGASNMLVDVLTFLGGDSEGERFQREYDPSADRLSGRHTDRYAAAACAQATARSSIFCIFRIGKALPTGVGLSNRAFRRNIERISAIRYGTVGIRKYFFLFQRRFFRREFQKRVYLQNAVLARQIFDLIQNRRRVLSKTDTKGAFYRNAPQRIGPAWHRIQGKAR